MFGEIDISINATGYKPKSDLDLDRIDQKMVDIFVEPTDNWHEWYNEETSNINLTWSIVEISSDRMRIKIKFNDPVSVSPFLRYDNLVVHVPDLMPLFEPVEKIEGRRLQTLTKI